MRIPGEVAEDGRVLSGRQVDIRCEFALVRCGMLFAMLLLGSLCASVRADGTETLGPPSVAISQGSGIVAAGVGLGSPGLIRASRETVEPTIVLDVPGSRVNQALLYWSGEGYEAGDDTLIVDHGTGPQSLTGTLIGGPTEFFSALGFGKVHVTTFRADITDLVSPGENTLAIDGADFGFSSSGAGLLVVYDDGTVDNIDVRDGQDLAFARFPATLDTTVPQTFPYAASTIGRTATLVLFVASVGTGDVRPSLIRVTVEGGDTLEFPNLLASVDGPLWDTVRIAVSIPAGSASLTVEVLSVEDGSVRLPASLAWIGASLSMNRPDPCEGVDCDDDDACTQDVCNPQTGECEYTTIDCDDSNACTADSCDPAQGCIHDDITPTCNDGVACTVDGCDPASGCTYAPDDSLCNDSNACTADTCDVVQGCLYEDISDECDDDNVCTADSCDPAVGCVYEDISDTCDDGVACTVDNCHPSSGCTNVPDDALCHDGNRCTSDHCDAVQGCVYEDISYLCIDEIVCTVDGCDPALGCVNTPDDTLCDDTDACTTDVCDPAQGCVYEDITCDDGVSCTRDDCDPASGCVNAPDDTLCNDNDLCTADHCDAVEDCVYEDISDECDDANVCTADRCDPALGCVYEDISDMCDDGVACTHDACDPVSGCTNIPDDLLCDDGDVCTGDVCTLTGCQYHDNGLCQACCIADLCIDTTITDCLAQGGTPQGIGTTCAVVICTVCGNGVVEPGEECDGADDDACPGQCLGDCTCHVELPTLSTWGTIVLALLLLVFAKLKLSLRPRMQRA